MAPQYLDDFDQVPFVGQVARLGGGGIGRYWVVVKGKKTESGHPILSSDPHLGLSTPPIWYQIQLNVKGKGEAPLNVSGVSFAGAPGVILGHNDNIAWGATVTGFDVTDVYQEQLAVEFGGFFILDKGQKQKIVIVNETFRVNQIAPDKNDNIVVTTAGVPPQ